MSLSNVSIISKKEVAIPPTIVYRHQSLTEELNCLNNTKDQDKHDETDDFKQPSTSTSSIIKKLSNSHIFGNQTSPPPSQASVLQLTSDEAAMNEPIQAQKASSFAKFKDNIAEISEATIQPIIERQHFKSFWRKIEFKIVEELFLLCHDLPREFNFGAYVGYRFQKYIAEVGNISSSSWFLLGLVVTLNIAVASIKGKFVRPTAVCS